MDRWFNKKRKKSSEPPQQLGISTNTVVGPEFLAEMDIDPNGRPSCSFQDPEVDQVDLATTPGERDGRGPRTSLQDKSGGSQDLPAPGVSTSGVVDPGAGHGNDRISECSES